MDEMSKNKELAVFWAQSQPAIAAFIYSLVPNFQDADDILQNVAVITVENFDEFDRNRSFSSWAKGIAKNLIMRYYSRKGKQQPVLNTEAVQKIALVYEQESQHFHDQKESMENALRKCLNQLQAKWRKIVDMHYRYEHSPARIAQQLSMTRSNVFVSLHRIRLSLKRCVKQQLQELQ